MAIAASPSVGPMSAAEYLATPEDRPRHTELINGMVVVNEPTLPHQRAQLSLARRLADWIDEGEGRGYVGLPGDMHVDDLNVFAPDVWWVGEDRRPTADQEYLDGLPDLVVEIRSPSTWARDLGVKLPTYEAAGVAEAWFVDTEARTVLVYRRTTTGAPTFDVTSEVGADEVLASPLLAGFELPVATIFAG